MEISSIQGESATRVAIIDLGTNTFHLLIADIKDTKPIIVHQQTLAVRLGEGGISEGIISPKPFDRGIKALIEFKTYIDKFQCTIIRSAATSAIRSASNGNEFIKEVKAATGLDLDIIEGEREAELIYKGVNAAVDIQETSLIVDIGGGSVEFIICGFDGIFWKKSYPIGAARMMDEFHQNDPITSREIASMNIFLENALTDLKEQLNIYRPAILVGSAGAFETFAALSNPQFEASFEHPQHSIDFDRFIQISHTIIKSTHSERKSMPEIPPVRVDMIVVATIMVDFLLDLTGIKNLKLSTYSLKEGLLFEVVNTLSG